jgi:hypothetical protein
MPNRAYRSKCDDASPAGAIPSYDHKKFSPEIGNISHISINFAQ